MITTRDMQIVEFLDGYKIANTSTIAELFFPSAEACYKRLQVLSENKVIRRMRDSINNEYLYFHKKIPKQLKHSLLVSSFYRELHRISGVNILNFKIEPTLGDIRPDAVFAYKYNGKNYLGLLEVEISNKGFNYGKYERFYGNGDYKSYFPAMPTVFVVGDNIKLPEDNKTKVQYKIIKTSLEGII